VLERQPLWERPVLREAAGDTLRPGGFTLTDRAAEVMGLLPGWRVLDVGCGLGATVGRLRARFGADAYGIESSPRQLDGLTGRHGFVQAHAGDIPFRGASFSALFCECVLSLLPDPRDGLREFNRVLAPGGWLALSDLHADSLPTPGDGSCAGRALPFCRVRQAVEEAGFEVVLMEDHGRLLKELAAKLLLAGDADHACGCRPGLGYYLMVARKKGRNDV